MTDQNDVSLFLAALDSEPSAATAPIDEVYCGAGKNPSSEKIRTFCQPRECCHLALIEQAQRKGLPPERM